MHAWNYGQYYCLVKHAFQEEKINLLCLSFIFVIFPGNYEGQKVFAS